MLKLKQVALQTFIAMLLGACAGGGGGGGGVVPVSPPVTFPPLSPPHASGDFPNTSGSEYNASWGVAGTNAVVAWQHDATGAGIKVGVIDDGIDPNHPEFVGRVTPDSIDIVSGRNKLTSAETHGSEVASIIAGNYNNSQTVGLAFDATILSIRADNGSGAFNSNDLANAINYATDHGARVINLSLGSASPTGLAVQSAMTRATNAGVILVFAAGNEGGSGGATQPDYPGFLATDNSVSHGLIMIAGGLNPDGTVNPASNPPGTALNWYLTAPGWGIIVPDFGQPGGDPHFEACGLGPSANLCEIQGTSFATPQVVGAIALVLQAFPGLTPAQAVDLLLNTTDDTGAPGTDAVNGRGRLNIGRAFQPVGPLAIPLAMGAPSIVPSTLLGVVGPAFGDGLSRNSAAWSVVGFDKYYRTFNVNLASNWLESASGVAADAAPPALWRTRTTRGGVTMQMALADESAPELLRTPLAREDLQQPATRIDASLGNGLDFSFAARGGGALYEDAADAIGHFGLVNGDTSLRLTQRLGAASLSLMSVSGEAPNGLLHAPTSRAGSAVRASLNVPGGAVNLTYGSINEQGGVLGLAWSDAISATPSGQTTFTGVSGQFSPAPGWHLVFDAEYGEASFNRSGWLNVAAPLRTTTFSIGVRRDYAPDWLEQFDGSGSLNLLLTQPLRIESGAMSFMAPVATAYGYKSLRFEPRTFDVTPSGRELQLSLNYRYTSADWLSAFAEALYVVDPGHVAGAEPQSIVRIGVRLAH